MGKGWKESVPKYTPPPPTRPNNACQSSVQDPGATLESALGASHPVLRFGVFPRRRMGKSEKFLHTPVVAPYPLSPAWTLRTKAHERRKVTGWMVMVMSEQTISPALVPREWIFSFCIYEREL